MRKFEERWKVGAVVFSLAGRLPAAVLTLLVFLLALSRLGCCYWLLSEPDQLSGLQIAGGLACFLWMPNIASAWRGSRLANQLERFEAVAWFPVRLITTLGVGLPVLA